MLTFGALFGKVAQYMSAAPYGDLIGYIKLGGLHRVYGKLIVQHIISLPIAIVGVLHLTIGAGVAHRIFVGDIVGKLHIARLDGDPFAQIDRGQGVFPLVGL